MQSPQPEQRLEGIANPLPRSVRRDAPFELLDGSWRFDLDVKDEGLSAHWERGHEYRDAAIWPGSIERHLLGGPDVNQRAPWKDSVVAWSERDF